MMRLTFALIATTGLVACVDTTDVDPTGRQTGVAVGPASSAPGAAELTVDPTATELDATPETCLAPKVLVCHIPPGNPGNAHTICIAAEAVQAHLDNHGDYLGVCNPPPPPPPPPVC